MMHQAVKHEVAKKMREVQAQPDINIISQPYDGKLLLISNLSPEKIVMALSVLGLGARGNTFWRAGRNRLVSANRRFLKKPTPSSGILSSPMIGTITETRC